VSKYFAALVFCETVVDELIPEEARSKESKPCKEIELSTQPQWDEHSTSLIGHGSHDKEIPRDGRKYEFHIQ
jgi:hypothetical protein